MSQEAYEVDKFLDLERPHRERQYRTLEAFELVRDKCTTFLEEDFRQHPAQHRAKEMETENEKVKAT